MNDILQFMGTLITAAVTMSIPLTLAGIGEIISEKAGILNIGMEANMLSGAFFSFAFAYISGSLVFGVLGGVIGGVLVCMLHAFISVNLHQDQTVVGISLNIFLLGVTSYLLKMLVAGNPDYPKIQTFSRLPIPLLNDIPVIGKAFFNQDIFAYFTYLLIIVSIVFLYRTQWGASLHAVGEHPRAADTVGINVFKVQYTAAFVNGVLSGLAGAYMSLVQLGVFTENMTAGRGYIVLAVVIFGRRNPLRTWIAAILFGASEAMQFRLQAIGVAIPSQILNMLPYAITIVVLILSSGKHRDPAHLGKPYMRNSR